VQGSAIAATRRLLERWGVPGPSWELIPQGHECMQEAIPAQWHGRAGAILFNLGYLPGSDKSVVTRAETTLLAMRAGLEMLRPGGVMVAVLYTGHPGGMEEARTVREFAAGLPPEAWHVAEYSVLNTRTPAPSVLAVEKAATVLEPEYCI
jgi:Putative rRNA methylase